MEHNASFHVVMNFPVEKVWEALTDESYVDKLFKEQGMERTVLNNCISIKEEGFQYEMARQGAVIASSEIIEVVDEEEEKRITERMYNMVTKMTTVNSYSYRPIENTNSTLIVSRFSLFSEDKVVAANYIEMISDLVRFMFVSLENELKRKSSLSKVHESRELDLPFKEAKSILENPLNMKELNLLEFAEEDRPGQWTIIGKDEETKRVVQFDTIYEEDEFILTLTFRNSFGKIEETTTIEVLELDEETSVFTVESEVPPQHTDRTSRRISLFFQSLVDIPEDEEKMRKLASLEASTVHA